MIDTVDTINTKGANQGNVAQESSEHDDQLRRQIVQNLHYYAKYPEQIDLRLQELDQEWDIDLMLEMHLSAIALVGLLVGMVGRRRWYLFPIVACSFLIQQAFRGWSPPVELFRRFGIRSKKEIMREYYALRALRGDFGSLGVADRSELPQRVDAVLNAVW
ncbi:MAG: hypothetical protein ACLFSB_09500 [Chitinispirillaceae bacterium]